MKDSKKTSDFSMISILNNPRFQGKHVIVIGGNVYTAKSGARANKLLDKLEKKYPKQTPAITYIPKADTLILWL